MTSILLPALVLMLVTALVWLKMLIARITTFKKNDIHPQSVSTPEKLIKVLDDKASAPGNCFKNLLELPVLFYFLCAFIALTGSVDSLYSGLAWAFVIFRALHAIVHCTYNKVMHRFYAYFISSVLLWIMLLRFFLSLL